MGFSPTSTSQDLELRKFAFAFFLRPNFCQVWRPCRTGASVPCLQMNLTSDASFKFPTRKRASHYSRIFVLFCITVKQFFQRPNSLFTIFVGLSGTKGPGKLHGLKSEVLALFNLSKHVMPTPRVCSAWRIRDSSNNRQCWYDKRVVESDYPDWPRSA